VVSPVKDVCEPDGLLTTIADRGRAGGEPGPLMPDTGALLFAIAFLLAFLGFRYPAG